MPFELNSPLYALQTSLFINLCRDTLSHWYQFQIPQGPLFPYNRSDAHSKIPRWLPKPLLTQSLCYVTDYKFSLLKRPFIMAYTP